MGFTADDFTIDIDSTVTVVEQARAVQTMLDLGLTQTAVAKATGVCAKTVRAAKKAATLTDDQLDETAKYDLTLDQLAVIAELGTDDDSYRRLVSAAATAGWLTPRRASGPTARSRPRPTSSPPSTLRWATRSWTTLSTIGRSRTC